MLSANQNAEILVCILLGIRQANKGQISTIKLKFQALALCQSKTFSQPTYPEEAEDAFQANNEEKTVTSLSHQNDSSYHTWEEILKTYTENEI